MVHVFGGNLTVPQPLFSLLLRTGFDGLMDDEMCIALPCNSKLEMKQRTVMQGVLLVPFMTCQLLLSSLPSVEEMTASLPNE